MRRLKLASVLAAASMSVSVVLAPVSNAEGAYITPGDAIIVTNGDSGGLCTLGPYMEVDGVYGAVTAGHCGDDGSTVSLRTTSGNPLPISKLHGSTDTETTDSAFIPLSASLVEPSASILGKFPVEGAMDMPEILGVLHNPAIAPTRVCSTGVTSDTRCGNITGVSLTYNRIYARFPSDKGDSGGPVWAAGDDGVRVVGILRGKLMSDPTLSVILPISVAIREQGGRLLSVG